MLQYCTEHSVLQTGQPCCLSDTRRAQRTFLPFAAAWTRAADVLLSAGMTPAPFLYQRTQLPPGFWRPSSRPSISPGRPCLPIRPPGLSCVPPVLCSTGIGQGALSLHSPVFPVSRGKGQCLVPRIPHSSLGPSEWRGCRGCSNKCLSSE